MASLPPNINWLRDAADEYDGAFVLVIGGERYIMTVDRYEEDDDA